MSKQLWTLAEIEHALNVSVAGNAHANTPITGVSIDTRTLKPGDVFIALAGTPSGGFVSSFESTNDGHNYVANAVEKGATALIVNRVFPDLDVPQFVVEDTLINGLWALAEAARARTSATVIALTGSCGKTGTKEFLKAGLKAHAPKGSYNNFWGVPYTLATMPRDAVYGVFELGMNQPGEIARLSALVKPHVALVTNVHPVHVEHMAGIAGIRREKLSIVEGLEEEGTLVIPHDLACNYTGNILRFGPKQDVSITSFIADAVWQVKVGAGKENLSFTLNPGSPARLENALAATAAMVAANAPLVGVTAFEDVAVMPGRGVVTWANGITVIDDSFNGNPASIAMGLANVKAHKANYRLAILGDMLELGAEAPRYHAALAAHCAGVDEVICVGALMEHLYNALPAGIVKRHVPDQNHIDINTLIGGLPTGSVIFVKGSKKLFWVNAFTTRLISAIEQKTT